VQIGLEGKFSVYHCCAVALIFGQAGEDEYSDAIVNRADVLAIMKDGTRKHLFIEHAIGSLQRPMTDADLEAKFHVQTDAVLGKAKIDALIVAAWKMVSIANVNDLTKLAI
jgi:2-methylcitrate dehydratase PrpD